MYFEIARYFVQEYISQTSQNYLNNQLSIALINLNIQWTIFNAYYMFKAIIHMLYTNFLPDMCFQ